MANNRLSTIITIGGAVTAGLRTAIGSTVGGLRQIGGAIDNLRTRQRELTRVMAEQERLGTAGSGLRHRLAQQELEDINRRIAGYRRLQERLTTISAAQQANSARRSATGSKIGSTVAAGVGFALPLIGAAKAATEFQYQMRLIGNTAEMSDKDVRALADSILDVSKKTNQSAVNTQRGLGFLIAAGMEVKTARDIIMSVGKATTATGGDVEDLAKAAFTLNDSLKIAPGKIMAALDSLAKAGKEGNVELKDMAKVLPVIGSGFVSLKMEGREAAATIGAALQIARKGAGDADEAANNMKNFIAKIMSPETLKKATKNFNLDLYKVITDAQKSGANPFDAAMMAVMKATKGDQKKIGELFTDMQVQNFVRPMIQNWDKYQEIKSKALGADGTIDRDFVTMMGTAKEQVNQLTQSFGRLGIAIGDAVLGMKGGGGNSSFVDSATEWTKANESIVGTSIKVVGGLIGIRLATLGVTYAWTVLRGAYLGGAMVLARASTALALYRAGALGATIASTGLGGAILAVGAAIMATPIGWIIAGIAGIVAGGMLIYKYWEPLKAFFVGFGEGLTAGMQPFITVIKPVVMPILEAVGSWVKSAVGWFGELLTPIGAATETTKAFGEAGKVCGEVIAKAFTLMLTPITNVMNAIKWIADNAAKVGSLFSGSGTSAPNAPMEYDAMGNPTGMGAAPAVPPMRGGAGSGAAASPTTNNNITINQQPGQDSRALAAEVARRIEQQNAVRARSSMADRAF